MAPPTHWTPELLAQIAADYPHMTGDLLKEKYGVSAATLRSVLRHRGIKVKQTRRCLSETKQKAAMSGWITRHVRIRNLPLDCVTCEQAAAYLGLCRRSIAYIIQRKHLRAHKRKDHSRWIWMVSERDIHAFLREFGGFMDLAPVVEEFAETYAAAQAEVRRRYINVAELSQLAYVDTSAVLQRLKRHKLPSFHVARQCWYDRAAALAIYGLTEHADGTITRA